MIYDIRLQRWRGVFRSWERFGGCRFRPGLGLNGDRGYTDCCSEGVPGSWWGWVLGTVSSIGVMRVGMMRNYTPHHLA
jgi:hypothetical protein